MGCHSPGTGQNVEGVRYYQQGQPQAAVAAFQEALVENPNNPEAYYNLASAYHYLGKQNSDSAMLQQAENLYHRCLDLSPDDVACHRALAVLLVDTNRAQSAFTLLERWANRSPQLADPRIELARLHEEFGETDAAQRYLAEAIDVDPMNARAWTAMAHLREESGQYAQALSNYQQAQYMNAAQPGVAERIATLQQQLRMASVPPQVGGSPSTRSPQGTLAIENQDGWTKR
jgi:tetratricopeptide (TPR) repeat protein